jgi:SET domain-containing protein
MLRVKTYLDKSPIEGIGVFAAQKIADGALVWSFEPQIDKVLDMDESTLKYQYFLDKEFIMTYAYFDKQLNKYILSVDNDRFTNHSDNPNTIPLPTGEVVADRDIYIGEEITINYFAIDTYAEDKLKFI